MKANEDQRAVFGTPVIVPSNGYWFYGRLHNDVIQMDIENFATGAEALAWCLNRGIAANFMIQKPIVKDGKDMVNQTWLTMVQIDHLQTIGNGDRPKHRQELRALERMRMIARGKPIKRRITWYLLLNGISALKELQLPCKVKPLKAKE